MEQNFFASVCFVNPKIIRGSILAQYNCFTSYCRIVRVVDVLPPIVFLKSNLDKGQIAKTRWTAITSVFNPHTQTQWQHDTIVIRTLGVSLDTTSKYIHF